MKPMKEGESTTSKSIVRYRNKNVVTIFDVLTEKKTEIKLNTAIDEFATVISLKGVIYAMGDKAKLERSIK